VRNSCPVHLQTTPDLLKIDNNIRVFWNWCRVQNVTPGQLFCEIATIMDKVILKTNTLIVIGASISGKTRVINNPLVFVPETGTVYCRKILLYFQENRPNVRSKKVSYR